MSPARATPKAMAKRLVRLLRAQHPDYHYIKKVFQHTRELLDIGSAPPVKRLPELLTDAELVAFYEAIWQARQLTHAVMLKLLLFTGMRNAELVHLRATDVDLQTCQLRITQGKGHQDRYVLFPTSFRGELAQYLERQQQHGGPYLFESNRVRPYSTRRLRQIVRQYASTAGITKRVYPHLFRHQLMTYLTKQGLISPKLQLLSGHTAAPGKFEAKRCCSATRVSVQSQGRRYCFRNFRSSLEKRVPLGGRENANFLERLCPL